ncbi:MAG: glycosyltransferase family 2 protein [Paludibacter sp.]|nr:glycosyltransferase family 2 protein [Bacteroidales bacterium]MCM1068586.1 glycosyltransferase family 2 protein [Prevotella sp.]MCM1353250.1 glycosyltransferase family 2 protein [Bacteroides sp.]MCM1442342.1 glycosyltransferase family 2 protein [Muribaculum sp.]MCM1481161.1 glycosyltransferase family 2 protein [Paludibacter sp.]
MNNTVSIITPLYNGERFIAQTIESVLSQTYPHWEMLIINDGSTDNSEHIAMQYAQQDNRIQVISQPNAGSAAARNNGIRRATGRYIALLDADDLWENYFLESQLQLLHNKQCTLVYGAHKRINEIGEEILQPFYPPTQLTYNDLLKTCSITCLTALYDTMPYGKLFLHEEFKSLRDDYIYWLEILKKAGTAYGNTRIVGSYRILGNSVSRNKKKVIKPQYRVYKEVEKLSTLTSLYYLACWAINGFFKYRK